MARVIGNADDFYRLRIVRVDAGDSPDFEWRDDILWRQPTIELPAEEDVFRVEAVELDDEDAVHVIAELGTADEAREWLAAVQADLSEMTKSEFEETYFVDVLGDGIADDDFEGLGF
ncbi:MAG: hypothetical protein LLG24_01985 [Actinomycetia bacterium]|nr:hypothetical protein [Actinomycetes bacterium]